jgi:cytochrome c oxidase cbb3-type subunit II
VMPKYAFLSNAEIDGKYIEDIMKTHLMVGVPYTSEMLDNAVADFKAQADPNADTAGLEERYKKVTVANFDGTPALTEMDALIAYLQVLGTMVDFSTFIPDPKR